MTSSPLAAAIVQRFPRAVLASHEYRGDTTVIVRRESLQEVALALKDDPAFQMNFLVDVTAVDFSAFGTEPSRAFFASSGVGARSSPQIPDAEQWPGPPAGGRFVVVYHFYSFALKHRLRVEVPIEETDAEVDSLAGLWPASDWLEREVWDMFGIRFRGHANLKRILMYDEFEGHPLRKDYPVNQRQPLIGPVN